MKPSGRAGIILPAGSLVRGGREEEIRRSLIAAGAVEGVVLLPPRLRANTSIPLAVWLLKSPDAGEHLEEILLVDASGLGKPGRSRFSLEEESIDRLGALVQTWRVQPEISGDDAEIALAVPVSSIKDANLDPRRYQTMPKADIHALELHIQELRAKVSENMAETREALTQLAEHLDGFR
jgi:type I restriction enzyme M protein